MYSERQSAQSKLEHVPLHHQVVDIVICTGDSQQKRDRYNKLYPPAAGLTTDGKLRNIWRRYDADDKAIDIKIAYFWRYLLIKK
jgi:hypothetical protein